MNFGVGIMALPLLLATSLMAGVDSRAATCSDREYSVFIECLNMGKQYKEAQEKPWLYEEWEIDSLEKKGAEKCVPFSRFDIFEACMDRMFRENLPIAPG
ncbi:MAG: hypothetical protein F4X32_07780 [Candidatus Dadabacteria bacterium]|nr:hypothetical protein [Candidatus Dadabacteria bacterium]